MIHQNAARFFGDIAYDDHFNGIAEATKEGERMATAIGDKRILFLANHGVVVVGATVAQALDDFYYLERACQVQILAMQSGQPLKVMSAAMARETHEQFTRFSVNAELLLEDVRATLDVEEPGYVSAAAMPGCPPRWKQRSTGWTASFSKRPNLASVPARAMAAASAAG